MEFFTLPDLAIGASVAAVVHGVVAASAARAVAAHRAWVDSHPQVTGVVDRIHAINGAGGDTSYKPVVVYTLPGRQRYSIDGYLSESPEVKVGDAIRVAYDESMPSTARIVEPPPWTRSGTAGTVIGYIVLTAVATFVVAFIRA
jgi:hypothetical protein